MSMVLLHANALYAGPRGGVGLADFSEEEAQKVRAFHAGFAEYAPTELVGLPHLARRLGIGGVFVKDESTRFGLQSFKALGGSYAVARALARRWNLPEEALSRQELQTLAAGREQVTFATATDGNHGRGIAWTARVLGQKAVVYMPKGSALSRVEHIRSLGAVCLVTEENYDNTVRLAEREARQNGWILVQDTAWPGYEEIPRHISQGYLTLALEAWEQCAAQAGGPPTHLFLQAGVGSFAAAILGFFTEKMWNNLPVAATVEPHAANCMYQSMRAGDGRAHNVGGDLVTLMAGLACGEPSSISWPVLRDYARFAVSCDDALAALGMRMLAAPLRGDRPVLSGESGAAPLGVLAWLLRPENVPLARQLELERKARVLLISTEGNTSPEMYERVVWEGKYPLCGIEE